MQVCMLPSDGTTVLSHWPTRKINLRCTPRKIAYHAKFVGSSIYSNPCQSDLFIGVFVCGAQFPPRPPEKTLLLWPCPKIALAFAPWTMAGLNCMNLVCSCGHFLLSLVDSPHLSESYDSCANRPQDASRKRFPHSKDFRPALLLVSVLSGLVCGDGSVR